MAGHVCIATVLGHMSGSDREFRFEMPVDPVSCPADELIEAFMDHLHARGDLRTENDYELNAVVRKEQQRIVLAIGSLILGRDHIPLALLVSY